MTRELLLKYLDNHCSAEELNEVLQWIEKEASSEKGRSYAYDDWKLFIKNDHTESYSEHFDHLLDQIHHKINISGVESKKEEKNIILKITRWTTRVAAILLVPVLILLAYVLSNPFSVSSFFASSPVDSLEVIAPAGSRTIVQLVDGTTVHLNNGSKIKYPRFFNRKTRELSLVGEGYFEVAHDSKHPFIVKTKNMDVKVLGTKFNVKTYPDNDVVSTTLVEGKVVLEKRNEKGKIRTIGALTPGQHVDYNTKTGALTCSVENVKKYTSWKDGYLVFDKSTIEEVAERLEHMFNVDIKISDEIDYTYTSTFIDESLPQILDLLSKVTPVGYKILPRERMADGTYSKQTIIFEKQKKYNNPN